MGRGKRKLVGFEFKKKVSSISHMYNLKKNIHYFMTDSAVDFLNKTSKKKSFYAQRFSLNLINLYQIWNMFNNISLIWHKRNSVSRQINRKMVIIIQILFRLTRFRKYLYIITRRLQEPFNMIKYYYKKIISCT